MTGARLEGMVSDFDPAVGLGTVEAAGGARYRFHCTQVADGSRQVEPGTPVVFVVVAAHGGQWEAAAVAAAGSGGPLSSG